MRKILLLGLLFINGAGFSQDVNIVPQPVSMKVNKGKFTVDAKTVIVGFDNEDKKIAGLLNNYLLNLYGRKLSIVSSSRSNYIRISTKKFIKAPDKDGYSFEVNKNGVTISGDTYKGTFYGMQTLLQLLPESKKKTWVIPQLSIEDYPRFEYRGMHLDVARHFFPVSFIKKYIDYLAYHKFNMFHWHLTDDQGWRIEIKKYPKLTSVGAYRNGTIVGRYPGRGNDSIHYGGYYTQEQIKDIVKYAADRYITVIPEIEMPGHSSAAIAAYPELSCFPDSVSAVLPTTPWAGIKTGKQVQQTWGVFNDVYCPSEHTFQFLEDVLDEVMELFPSQFIHIGGDEAPKEAWKSSAFSQQLIRQLGLKDEHALQTYFIGRIEKYLNSKGRSIIGWDEILEGGLTANSTIMSWQGEKGGIEAAKQHHKVIMTPGGYCYFDHSQTKNDDSLTRGGYIPIEKVYGYEPVPAALDSSEAKYILGAQGNVWTEYFNKPSKVEYMIFPRMSALSEVLWSPKDKRDWKSFEKRIPWMFQKYRLWGAMYSTAFYDLQSNVIPTEDNNGVYWTLKTNKKDEKIYHTLQREPKRVIVALSEMRIKIWNTREDSVYTILDNGEAKYLKQKFYFTKATGKMIILKDSASPNYPGSGAFTLVNGIVTERQLSQSSEWLGFLGKNMEAVIDLGKVDSIHRVAVDVLRQEGSWIYLPSAVEYYTSNDNGTFTLQGSLMPDSSGNWPNERKIAIELSNVRTRYVKVVAKNYGIIPTGKPGASTRAWLFVDEIEIE